MIFRIVKNDKTCLFVEGESMASMQRILNQYKFLVATHSKTGNQELVNTYNIDTIRQSHYTTIEDAVAETVREHAKKNGINKKLERKRNEIGQK